MLSKLNIVVPLAVGSSATIALWYFISFKPRNSIRKYHKTYRFGKEYAIMKIAGCFHEMLE
jgi:hypothetical protein